jgi:hypothetical protein
MNERRAYCGLLDDFAIRHRDGHPIETLEQLNEHLLFTMIAGDPLVINDGYLLQNPAVREAIMRPEDSPFRRLVECGFVRVLSRNGGAIERLAETMANQNTTSAEQLLEDQLYREEYQPALAQWSEELNSGYFDWFRAWPAHRTDHVYGKMGSTIIDALRDRGPELRPEIERFVDVLGDDVGSRTAWEDTARKLREQGLLSPVVFERLMAGANEAYQYAWGCALADAQNPTSVQTRVPRFLSELDLTEAEPTADARSSVTVFVPALEPASKGVAGQWDELARAASPASDANRAKREYLTALSKYFAGDERVDHRQMKDLASEYSQTLARTFGHKKTKKVQAGLDVTFAALSTVGSIALTGPVGVAIGVGLTASGLGASHAPPAQKLIARLGQTKPRKWIREVPADEAARMTSAFALKPSAARGVLDGVPLFSE